MTRLFDAAGVDYVQWRALVRAYIRIDYAGLFGAFGAREARRTAVRLALTWVFLSMLGFGLGASVWAARDPFLAAILVTTTMMLWSGLLVLTQPAGLASPDDHEIVGYRPVSSRTFFAVRVTAVLVPTAEAATLMGWVPVVAFATRTDGSPSLAFAALAAIVGAILAAAMAVIVLYGWLIRIVPPAILTRVLAYTGAIASLALTAGVMLGTTHLAESEAPGALLTTIVPRDMGTMWFPPAWFASYVAVAGGERASAVTGAALLSIVAIAGMAVILRGRLSGDYAAGITAYDSVPAARRITGERAWTFLGAELRAVFIIVGSHLRRDVRFQLAIASNVAMGVLFTALNLSFKTLPADPFEGGGQEAGLMAPLFAVLFVPAQVYQALVVSTAHEASWLFFSTPAHRRMLVTGARDAVAAFVLMPLVLLLAVYYVYAFGHAGHGLLHALFLGLMAYASLQLNVLIAPRLPFSVPMTAVSRPGGIPVFSSILVMLIGAPVFVAFQLVAYRTGLHAAAGLAGLVLVNLALNRATRRRIDRRATSIIYLS